MLRTAAMKAVRAMMVMVMIDWKIRKKIPISLPLVIFERR